MDDDDALEVSEDLLAELLDLIRGGGKYRGHGSGHATFPGGHVEDDAEHLRCVELERRGLARRVAIEGGWRWEAREPLRLFRG